MAAPEEQLSAAATPRHPATLLQPHTRVTAAQGQGVSHEGGNKNTWQTGKAEPKHSLISTMLCRALHGLDLIFTFGQRGQWLHQG